MGNDGKEGFEGPRLVRMNPEMNVVDDALKKAIDAGVSLLFSSGEPTIEEVRDALVELGERVREAEETRLEIARLRRQKDPDQEEINDILKGAVMTKDALLKAILNARSELEK